MVLSLIYCMEQVLIILALIISIVLHEMGHAFAANALGDPTARLQGRLSPNPFVHLDPLGSIIIPGILFITQAPILFGWAKPVPYNPYNLRDQRFGEAKVAIAGPLMNIGIALVFSALIRSAGALSLPEAFVGFSLSVVYINILLALFNMIPFPPLDGSKILLAFLPFRAALHYKNFMLALERIGFIATFLLIFLFINLFSAPFSSLVFSVFHLFTGEVGL